MVWLSIYIHMNWNEKMPMRLKCSLSFMRVLTCTVHQMDSVRPIGYGVRELNAQQLEKTHAKRQQTSKFKKTSSSI